MYEKRRTIISFTDLKAWQKGHELVLEIYAMTKRFPEEERYCLLPQMRRAASSVTANIAEGYGRQGLKEKIQFYYIAQRSLTELKDQLLIARDVGYLNEESFRKLIDSADSTGALLYGLIKKSKEYATA